MTSRTISWGRKVPMASRASASEVGHLDLHALVAQGHGEQVGDAVLVVDDEYARLEWTRSVLLGAILKEVPVSFL